MGTSNSTAPPALEVNQAKLPNLSAQDSGIDLSKYFKNSAIKTGNRVDAIAGMTNLSGKEKQDLFSNFLKNAAYGTSAPNMEALGKNYDPIDPGTSIADLFPASTAQHSSLLGQAVKKGLIDSIATLFI